jgi:hypothetical protein
MKAVVLTLTVAAIWGDAALAVEPAQPAGRAACRPLRPAPVTPASSVAIRVQPELPAGPAPAPAVELPASQPTTPDADLPAPITSGTDGYYLQRVSPAPWEYMKCIPPAPCRTPCYADNIRCEARMFRSTAPKCHCQAIHLSFRDALWNALDLPHAMHECCRKIHNTHFSPNPYARPYPYEDDCDW